MTPDVGLGELIDGRYRVLSRLGAGGMADVFLAEDQQLGRKVALKLLHRRFAEDPGFVERFRREAQAAAGLQHANVVSVFDRGRFDGTYYIAMEYLPGASLKELIRREAPLDSVRAIDIALQILAAARFAHQAGVIHRDLKPHNVIVDDAGHAKVTDFGIARAGASDMTETGSIMGTAQYLSPEQAQGRAVSPTSDLYSIGVVLYEMLTGRVPFDGDSPVTIALKHVSQPPAPPRSLNPAVPPELEQVVLWTLNKDPADRPADAETLIRALEHVRDRIVRGETAAATSEVPPIAGWVEREVVEPPPRRNPWPWLVALLLVLIAAGAVAAYLLTRSQQVVVPPVAGEQLNLARTVLQNDGFTVSVIDVNSPRAAGTVIGESPSGGSRAPKGSTVSLTVSQGPGVTTVPSVKGLPLKQAEKLIARAGLTVARVVMQSSTQLPAGAVISTDPAAGQTPQAGTGVAIFVSDGKPRVTVPDVIGQTQSDATATLQHAGFAVTTSSQVSSSSTPGTVVSQTPGANATATYGSSVAIVVAKAPTTVTVPDVTGDTAASARTTLMSEGLQVSETTRTTARAKQDGIVLSQSPSGGSSVAKGSSVTIVVGRLSPAPTTPTTSTTTTGTTPTTTATTPTS